MAGAPAGVCKCCARSCGRVTLEHSTHAATFRRHRCGGGIPPRAAGMEAHGGEGKLHRPGVQSRDSKFKCRRRKEFVIPRENAGGKNACRWW
jgi:hypothetical protein